MRIAERVMRNAVRVMRNAARVMRNMRHAPSALHDLRVISTLSGSRSRCAGGCQRAKFIRDLRDDRCPVVRDVLTK
jgi:hypothetical protein